MNALMYHMHEYVITRYSVHFVVADEDAVEDGCRHKRVAQALPCVVTWLL